MSDYDPTLDESGLDADDADGYEPPASQADLDRIIGERLARERSRYADYDELRERATQFDALVEASKSDQERLEEAAAKAATQANTLEAENLRLKVAIAKGLPPELIGRLQGSTQKELESDADTLLDLVNPPTHDQPDLRAAAGQRPITQEVTPDDWLRRMAGRG